MLSVPQSNSPVKTVVVWIRGWSVTQPRNVPTAPMRRNAKTVSVQTRLLFHAVSWKYKCSNDLTVIKSFLERRTNFSYVLLVNKRFQVLLQIPVDEQKGDLNFFVFFFFLLLIWAFQTFGHNDICHLKLL